MIDYIVGSAVLVLMVLYVADSLFHFGIFDKLSKL